MKTLFQKFGPLALGALAFAICLSAFANQHIRLKAGSSIDVGDTTVECLQDPLLSSPYRYAIFARLPVSDLKRLLMGGGIGSCRIEMSHGGQFEIFYSNRYSNGTALNNLRFMYEDRDAGVFRSALLSGDCE